ncbi:MAG: hypothetical protein IKZ46_00125, partial [Victivallales bacterium]|nr:hypothetical protein [Victivallales bacterium]
MRRRDGGTHVLCDGETPPPHRDGGTPPPHRDGGTHAGLLTRRRDACGTSHPQARRTRDYCGGRPQSGTFSVSPSF